MVESGHISLIELAPRPHLPTILWAYRKTIAIGALMGLLLGLVVALLTPTTYTSQATLIFPSAPVSGLAALTGGGSSDLPSVPLLQGALAMPQLGSSTGTAVLIVKSRRLKDKVIRSLNLGACWKLQERKEVIRRFDRSLQCVAGKSGDLTVGFQDESRELAYQVATAVVAELRSLTAELRLDPAADNVRFLQRKTSEAEQHVAAAQRDLAVYQRQYRIIDLPEQAKALAQQYADLQKDAATARLEAAIAVRQANLLSSHARQMVATAIDPNPGPTNTLGPLYQKVKEAESQLALLKYQLTDAHPQVQEQERILREARRLLEAETQRQLTALKSGNSPALSSVVLQAAGSQARAAGLQGAVSGLQQEVEKLPRQAADYTQLSGEVEAALQTLKLYRVELEKARILTQSRGPVFVEMDPAELPLEHDPSGRLVKILLPLLVGLGIALCLPVRAWQRRCDLYGEALMPR